MLATYDAWDEQSNSDGTWWMMDFKGCTHQATKHDDEWSTHTYIL